MRSSSIKSAALAITAALTLTAIAPIATARTTKSPSGTPSVMKQFEDATARATIAARRLLTRVFGPIANALPSPPLPVDTSLTASETMPEGTTPTGSVKPLKP